MKCNIQFSRCTVTQTRYEIRTEGEINWKIGKEEKGENYVFKEKPGSSHGLRRAKKLGLIPWCYLSHIMKWLYDCNIESLMTLERD